MNTRNEIAGRHLAAVAVATLAFALCGRAVAGDVNAARETLVDFQVEVQRKAPNDYGRATVFAEFVGADLADVAHKTKTRLADAVLIAKEVTGVTVKSGTTYTSPIYSKAERSIEAWRMRGELVLESTDPSALAVALGRLQKTLATGSFTFSPSLAARQVAEAGAELEGVERFQAKAQRIAHALGRAYRIRHLNIATSGGGHPQPMYRAATMMAESAPMPAEAGESPVTVTVSGQIELLER